MMKLYTVKDLASETFIKPFCFATDRDAKEGFKHVCNDPETPYSKFPADFELHSIGSFDERTGVLTVSSEKIARAVDMINIAISEGVENE